MDGLELHLLDAERLVLIAPDRAARWIASRFGGELGRVARRVLSRDVDVEVVTRTSLAARSTRVASTGPGDRVPASANCAYTFEQFVIGEGNRLAHAAALAVAEQPGHAYNPLFLCGPPGVGKTHLLHSISAYARTHADVSVCCVTADAFTSAFVRALQTREVGAFHNRFRNADVMLLDDVQFLEDKTRTEEELFHTFNALYESGRQLVFTSDRPPRDIEALEERLRERFESGLVADIAPPDFSTRLTILRRWARAELQTEVAPDVIEHVAAQATGNIRTLQGLLTSVLAKASIQRRTVDRDLVESALADFRRGRQRRDPLSIAEVQEVVARTYGVTIDELTSSSRARRVAWPRQLAMYLAREHTQATLPAIGRHFSRDHSTVVHACRRVQRRLVSEAEVREEAQRLVDLLAGPAADRHP